MKTLSSHIPIKLFTVLFAICAITATAKAKTKGKVEITRSQERTQAAEVDHVTTYLLPDGRVVKRAVTFHDWIHKGKPVSTDWNYTNARGTRKQLLIDYVFNPGSRSKLSTWTANGTRFTASSHISARGKTTSWERSARHGSGAIREVGRHIDGVRYRSTKVPANNSFTTTTRFTHPDGRTAVQKRWTAKKTIFVHTTMRGSNGKITQVTRRGQHRGKTLTLPRPFAMKK